VGVSFTEAAKRHAKDAKLLDRASRLANANHLWGFAAECALKAVLRALDPTLFKADGTPKKPHKEHVNVDVLWDDAHNLFSGRSASPLASKLPKTPNPFSGWSANARYYADGDVPDTPTHSRQQRGAQHCLFLLETARSLGYKE
jgi:hypothetical protein